MTSSSIFCLFLAVAAAQFFIFSLTPVVGNDTDFWWHLRTGKLIVESRAIPRQDIFSCTADGSPLLLQSWLPEVIYFLVYRCSGLEGLLLLRSCLYVLLFLLLFLLCYRRSGSFIPSAVSVLLVVPILQPFNDLRPYFFGFFFFIAAIFLMDLHREGKLRGIRILLLPLVFSLWANAHASFLLGLAICFLYLGAGFLKEHRLARGLEQDLRSSACHRRIGGSAAEVLAVIALCFSFCLANPYLGGIFTFPLRHLGMKLYISTLDEWLPPKWSDPFHHFYFYFFGLCVLLLPFAVKRKDFSLLFLFTLLSFLSLKAVRNIPFFALGMAPFVAENLLFLLSLPHLQKLWSVLKGRFFSRKSPLLPIYIPILSRILIAPILLFQLGYLYFAFPLTGLVRWESLPLDAVRFLCLNGIGGNLFNSYGWGGYLIWELYPQNRVFIDGRAGILYPESVFQEHLDVLRGKDVRGEILRKYDVNVIFLSRGDFASPFALRQLAGSRDWELLYRDNLAAVYVARLARNEAVLNLVREGRLKIPDSPFQAFYRGVQAVENGALDEAVAEFQRAIRGYPRFGAARFNLGYTLARLGRWDEAAREWQQALQDNPGTPRAHLHLGFYYERMRKYSRARREFLLELRLDPGCHEAADGILRVQGR